MKLPTTAAALVLAALPVMAQANSVASEEALKANHEPLKVSAETRDDAQRGQGFNHPVDGVSVALAETQRNVQDNSYHRTDFPEDNDDQPEVGHAADW